MKTRMTVEDIRAIATELRKKILNYRLANVYDLNNNKTYLLKFWQSEMGKFQVVIESGLRIHTTRFDRSKQNTPNPFTLKIRKVLRTRRVTSIEQLGIDRVLDFRFGEGEIAYHLIVEFYAKGNIILTDTNYKILAILRPHSHEENIRYAVNEIYPVSSRRQFTKLTEDVLRNLIKTNIEQNPNHSLRQVLTTNLDYGTGFGVHCMLHADFKENTIITQVDPSEGSEDIKKLVNAFHEADEFIENASKEAPPGYIILKEGKTLEDLEKIPKENHDERQKLYESFTPFLYEQFKHQAHIKLSSFDAAVDEFFSVAESKKIVTQQGQKQNAVLKKLDKIRKDNEDRVKRLEDETKLNERKAVLLEYNCIDVDQAIEVIRSAVAQAIDWEEIKAVIKEQQEEGDPIAKMIVGLKLETNQITVLLKPPLDDPIQKPEKVDVDISQSAMGNAKEFYQLKKKSEMKKQKTIEYFDTMMKAAEKKAEAKLKKSQERSSQQKIKQHRKRLWFEKFNWFITSDNFLVLSGREAQQNDILIRRYMKKGDIYVHADVHGAASCIIKNPTGRKISDVALSEAGIMTVCRSQAWTAKILANAWWVYDHQVSKTAPTGEYLPTGSFMIRGKKNFIYPKALEMGLAIMFRVHESSIPNHLDERTLKESEDDLQTPTDFSMDDKEEVFTLEDSKLEELEEEKTKDDIEIEENDDDEGEIISTMNSDTKKVSKKENQENKPRLTPKDRKRLKQLQKKGIEYNVALEMIKQQPEEKKDKQENQSTKESNKPIPRGKRSKLKKIKKKYGEQDEEERLLRMQLLGHKVELDGKKENEEQEKEVSEKELQERLKKAKEEEELKKLYLEENIPFLNPDAITDTAETNMLNSLTGKPREDDIILFAVPVCAPYVTVKDYKYRVRLVPGNEKRGTVVKQCMSGINEVAKKAPRELEIIKSIPESELSIVMIGNSKVALGSMHRGENVKKFKKTNKKKR